MTSSHVTPMPPPDTVFLLRLSVRIVCEAEPVGLCVRPCACVRCCFEWWRGGGEALTRPVFVQCTRKHTRTRAHALGTNRARLWTRSSVLHSLTLYRSARSLIFPSLYPSQMTHFFFPSLLADSLFVVAAAPPTSRGFECSEFTCRSARCGCVVSLQRPTSCFALSVRHPPVLRVLFLNFSSSLFVGLGGRRQKGLG